MVFRITSKTFYIHYIFNLKDFILNLMLFHKFLNILMKGINAWVH